MALLISELLRALTPISTVDTIAWVTKPSNIDYKTGYVIDDKGLNPHDRFYLQRGIKLVGEDAQKYLFLTRTTSHGITKDAHCTSIKRVLVSVTLEYSADNNDSITCEALDIIFTAPLSRVFDCALQSKNSKLATYVKEAQERLSKRKKVYMKHRSKIESEQAFIEIVIYFISISCKTNF